MNKSKIRKFDDTQENMYITVDENGDLDCAFKDKEELFDCVSDGDIVYEVSFVKKFKVVENNFHLEEVK